MKKNILKLQLAAAARALCVALLAACCLPSLAADKVEKVVAVIVDKAQLNKFGPTSNGIYGYQYTTDNRLSIDASACEADNLVLQMQVYIDNIVQPGNLTILQDAQFAQIDLGNDVTAGDTWMSWAVKDLNLQQGWNTLRLELKDAPMRGSAFSVQNVIQYFRFCFAFIPADLDAHLIRLKDVRLLDKSQLVDPDENGDPEWDATYLVGNTGVSINAVIDGPNAAQNNGFGFALGGAISPAIDASKHNPKQLYLMFDATITEQNAGDLAIVGQSQGQIEITSSGQPDRNELFWPIYYPDWKVGTHTYQIPFSAGSKNGGDLGELDYTNINYMRMYVVAVPLSFAGKVNIDVSNVRIVDLTNDVKLPTLFSDGMMFQQQRPIRVWGYNEPGQTVSADLLKNGAPLATETATVGADGRWQVEFPAQQASFDRYKLSVTVGGQLLQTVDDILVGEVWLAGGQSNMAYTVDEDVDAATLKASADNEFIRFYLEPTYPYSGNERGDMPATVQRDVKGAYWGYGNNAVQVGHLSSVAYTMARQLQQRLGVPVGILHTPVGGSVIEAWLSREAVDGDATVSGELKSRGMYFDEEWWIDDATTMTALYNQKIGPLKGASVAGVIWYQGESNSDRPEIYADELDLLRRSWSTFFGFDDGQMPFVFSQVARWNKSLSNPQALAPLDEAMADAWSRSPQTMAMLPLYDTDMRYERPINPDPIHPVSKVAIGRRFATAATNLVYAGGEYTAPVVSGVRAEDGRLVISFDHVGDGLQTLDGTASVHGFALAGADGVFVGANARITAPAEVTVSSPLVAAPTQATYAWATYNTVSNLANSVGIPASPFRTERQGAAVYYNPQDWTYADGPQTWGIDAAGKVGWVGTWTAQGATLSFNADRKAEGKAALQADYQQGGTVSISPVTSHQTTRLQLQHYGAVAVDALCLSGGAKTLGLQLTDASGNTYTAAPARQGQQVANATAFERVGFDLTRLTRADGQTVANAASVLATVTGMTFTVGDAGAGSICLDNVLFGTDASVFTGISQPGLSQQAAVSLDCDRAARTLSVSSSEPLRSVELFDARGCLLCRRDASLAAAGSVLLSLPQAVAGQGLLLRVTSATGARSVRKIVF